VRADILVLAEAVSVREGLLHVLGGGITRIDRADYPAPLDLHLAIRVIFDDPAQAEREGGHDIVVRLATEDETPVSDLTINFSLSPPMREPSGEVESDDGVAGLLDVSLADIRVPGPGRYLLIVTGDGESLGRVGLAALSTSTAQPSATT